MIIQILLMEKVENKLKQDAITGIFSDGARMAMKDEIIKSDKEKQVILNTGTYEWSEAMETIFRKSYDNLKMASQLPGANKESLKENGGVLGSSMAMAIYNVLLNNIEELEDKDNESSEVSLNRVFEIDLDFFSQYIPKEELKRFLLLDKGGLKSALDTLISDYDHIYACVFKDNIDKLNEIVDGE